MQTIETIISTRSKGERTPLLVMYLPEKDMVKLSFGDLTGHEAIATGENPVRLLLRPGNKIEEIIISNYINED